MQRTLILVLWAAVGLVPALGSARSPARALPPSAVSFDEGAPHVDTSPTERPTLSEAPAMTPIVPLPAPVKKAMIGTSWREGCPVSLDDLRLLKPRFVGFDGQPHTGEIVVHVSAAQDVAALFEELFAAGFQIERMERIDTFGGDDDKSMAANNTSAFNCRPVAGRNKGFSRHAYGVAIDVNPKTNPFVRPGKGAGGATRVDPPGAEIYLDRSQKLPGLIVKGDVAWRAFTSRGFSWGGSWRTMKDYQHFQRPLPR